MQRAQKKRLKSHRPFARIQAVCKRLPFAGEYSTGTSKRSSIWPTIRPCSACVTRLISFRRFHKCAVAEPWQSPVGGEIWSKDRLLNPARYAEDDFRLPRRLVKSTLRNRLQSAVAFHNRSNYFSTLEIAARLFLRRSRRSRIPKVI